MSRTPRSGRTGVVSVPVTVKASPEERDLWRTAASHAGLTVSDAIRSRMNRWAKRQLAKSKRGARR